jgi:hypothetical protein
MRQKGGSTNRSALQWSLHQALTLVISFLYTGQYNFQGCFNVIAKASWHGGIG